MAPLGVVEIIDAARRLPTGERIGIRAYGGIYKALGVTTDKFVAWNERYGFDRIGPGDDGSFLAPEFPVFSKVAWMWIDPVDLTASETKDLGLSAKKQFLILRTRQLRKSFAASETWQ